jgi:transglutaminase-like putative cysteine protease
MIDMLGRFMRWLIARIGALTIIQLAVLWVALGVTAAGMRIILPALEGIKVFWVVFFSVQLGWLLARSKLPGWILGPIGVIAGLAGLLLTIGRMSFPVGAFIHRGVIALSQHVRYPHVVDVKILSDAWGQVGDAFSALMLRLLVWYRVVSRGNIVTDPVVTAIIWAAALWLVALWAGWAVRRWKLALVALLPAIVLLTYTIYYTNSMKAIYSLVLLGGMLVLLQGASGYANALQRWQKRHVDRAEVEMEVGGTIFGIAVVLTLAGLLIPTISIKEINRRIHEYLDARRNENMASSLGMEQTPSASGVGWTSRGGGGPSSVLDIQGGPELSTDVMLYVRVDGYEYIPPDVQQHSGVEDTSPHYYWRGQTYDYYRGTGWLNVVTSGSDYQAGALLLPDLASPVPENFIEVQQHVRYPEPLNLIVVAGEFMSADQPYRAYWRGANDPINIETKASAYAARSLVPYVKVQQLREAGTDYPDSIRRYLQLPEKFPQRVRDLALDLTATLPTPYDQAVAIETYLRDFPYTLEVPGPPTGRDVADFFLFDLQKGYCNYYATAMAVMARAAGIPSRLVTGYATGFYDARMGEFVVSANNAHAWVEIYFPGIGWVEFEPTAGLALINRPQGGDEIYSLPPLVKPSDKAGSPQAILRRIWLERILRYIGLAGLVLFCLYLLPVENWLLLALSPDKSLKRIYRRLYRQGRRWKVEPDASRTPREFALQVAENLKASRMLGPKTLSALTADVDQLTGLYVRSLYSSRPATRSEKHQAIRLWSRLRRRLRWEKLKRLLAW